ncbi:2-pyrone-4,6-dicarboxylate hydrolase [Advenella sp. S44]|uniref:amidohydrolase family protein n=1 Tax=Advenella sp. S44 TaxID=1982755 RepID=UPI000C29D1C8|nr:amidohydrolase family protein [Advenella sp. S44]PJX28285.1 2-pyrone-4,6-dicarboxylate hydrolase [Advenella sp. S44]
MTENYIPDSVEMPRMPTAPAVTLPDGSCDTHCHVFGPYSTFPLHLRSTYAPPDAPAARYLSMLDTVGMQRGVLVQPAPYGTDVSAIMDAIAQRPETLRGIGVATPDTDAQQLMQWRAAGICGLRFIEARDPQGNLFPGSVGFDSIEILAPAMRAAGMHVQMWGPYDRYKPWLERVTDLGLPVVIDHMASVVLDRGMQDPLFQLVCRLLRENRLWIKLSVCRVSTQAPDYTDVRPFHDALLEANVNRVLWGSDWPYVRMGERAPDVGRLIDLAWDWFGNDTVRQQIWVDNPSTLYEFVEGAEQ